MYRPAHFRLHELVSKPFFDRFGERAWLAFDDRALRTLDLLRKEFGPAIVNTWATGGDRHLSGLRPMDSGVGAALSQHIFGRAFDVIFREVSAAEVRRKLYETTNLQDSPFRYITCIEDFPGMSWFHFDTRNSTAARPIVVGK